MSYCCHNSLTGNNHFCDSCNLQGLEMKFKDNFQRSGKVRGHEIIIMAHFPEKKG